MLIKFLFWFLIIYYGSKALFKWASGSGKAKEEKSSVKGERKQREVPYDPNDIVDAHFHDAPQDGKQDDTPDSEDDKS